MKQLKVSILMLLIFTMLTGVVYPVLITGIGRILFPAEAGGSLIVKDGIVKGSFLICQKFEKGGFFQGRPSAVNYNAGGSGGSNLGPANKKLVDTVIARKEQVMKDFNLSSETPVPSDFIFMSGSGLDPHISIEAAMLQVDRIAAERKIDKAVVAALVSSNSERQLYFYGSSFVNIIKLNTVLADNGGIK